jgi:hypothetical protein
MRTWPGAPVLRRARGVETSLRRRSRRLSQAERQRIGRPPGGRTGSRAGTHLLLAGTILARRRAVWANGLNVGETRAFVAFVTHAWDENRPCPRIKEMARDTFSDRSRFRDFELHKAFAASARKIVKGWQKPCVFRQWAYNHRARRDALNSNPPRSCISP